MEKKVAIPEEHNNDLINCFRIYSFYNKWNDILSTSTAINTPKSVHF